MAPRREFGPPAEQRSRFKEAICTHCTAPVWEMRPGAPHRGLICWYCGSRDTPENPVDWEGPHTGVECQRCFNKAERRSG